VTRGKRDLYPKISYHKKYQHRDEVTDFETGETVVNVRPLYLRFWYLEWVEEILRKMCKSFKFVIVNYDSRVKFVYFSCGTDSYYIIQGLRINILCRGGCYKHDVIF